MLVGDIHAQPANGKWTAVSQLPILTNARLIFADSLVGYYIGQDTGFVTKDGALTWTQLTFPPDATPGPLALFTPNPHTIISFQQRSDISVPGVIKSTDMGITWTVVSAGRLPTIKALTMWNENDGFRIWLDNNNKDFCAVTHDGGKTYSDIRGDATLEKYISKIYNGTYTIQSAWSDDLHGVISVSGKAIKTAYPMLLTSDGGRTWKEQYIKYNGDSTITHSYVFAYPGSGSMWVLPANAAQAHFLFYSSDYGSSWTTTDTLLRNPINGPYILHVAPVSPTASWQIMVANDRNPDQSQNLIDYKDINGKWIQDTIFSLQGQKNFSWHFGDIQFVDKDHGWASAIKSAFIRDSTGNLVQVVIDTAFIFRFRTTPQNSVNLSSKNSILQCIPNPASSLVSITGFSNDERIREIKLINTVGNLSGVNTKQFNSALELDISGIPNGCYLISIHTSLRKESIPVMVVH